MYAGRADIVGSFLRPAELVDVWVRYDAGALDAAGLRAVQDAAIRELIAQEERHGLPVVSDGEFRRRVFMESFAEVAGTERFREAMLNNAGSRLGGPTPQLLQRESGHGGRCAVTQRLSLIRNVPLDEYRFAASVATVPATVTVLGPDRIVQRFAYEQSHDIYPGGLDEFAGDVVRVEREILTGLCAAGCRYVHVDAPGYTAFVDEDSLAAMRGRGEDPPANMERSIRADNAVIAGFPEVTFGIHLCRGNSRSQWHRRGGYDAVAERLFNALDHQRFLLEYDDERSGGFEPLRFVPKGKIVVLGLITTKHGRLETSDELQRRIDEAARYIPIEQLALSPQCGFSSGILGNFLTHDEQWRKIDVMMQTVAAVWPNG
jgi:5-methyltetrahydropteroyltriglutamate--homocysteine methyltransferase